MELTLSHFLCGNFIILQDLEKSSILVKKVKKKEDACRSPFFALPSGAECGMILL